MIRAAALALVAVLRRREDIAGSNASALVQPVTASPEELERLHRALDEVEN